MSRGVPFQAAFVLALVLAAVAQDESAHPVSAAASQQPAATVKDDKPSDRERAGLHGPVKSYTVEFEYPARAGAPVIKSSSTWTYDRDGRLLEQRSSNSNGSETVTTVTNDAAGHLLRRQAVVQPGGASFAEETFSYDASGRLVGSVQTGPRSSRSDFQYDEQGNKTEVQSFAPMPGGVAVGNGISPFEAARIGGGVPEGGTVVTHYDRHDHPVALEIRDADGNVLSRAERKYDSAGRVSSENSTMENPQFLIPAAIRAQILKESGASAEELNQEIRKKMFGSADPSEDFSYAYDAQGRMTEVRVRSAFSGEQVTTTSYDDHGNAVLERTTRKAPPQAAGEDDSETLRLPPEAFPPLLEQRSTYIYDSFGNWTERTSSSRGSADAPFENARTIHRTITYY